MKVNQQFVDELLTKKNDASQLIKDDRFRSMFEDKEFNRDTNSAAYKHMKPVST